MEAQNAPMISNTAEEYERYEQLYKTVVVEHIFSLKRLALLFRIEELSPNYPKDKPWFAPSLVLVITAAGLTIQVRELAHTTNRTFFLTARTQIS